MATLEFTIAANGQITMRHLDSQGASCLAQTQRYSERLGPVIQQEMTSAFYETDTLPNYDVLHD